MAMSRKWNGESRTLVSAKAGKFLALPFLEWGKL